jgi:Uma2 family endonuclease
VLAEALDTDRDDRPQDDQIVVMSNVTWADYQRMLAIRGEGRWPRLCYLEGRLEIMSPSEPHEELKSVIGCLVEVFCLERGIEFRTLGSWTIEDEGVDRAVEADECYVFGERRKTSRPDLAIEVVWTSGGLNKLDIYRKLGVREVWYWRKGRISVHVLRGDAYEAAAQSEILTGIDLTELVSFLDRPTTSAAMRDYRDALRNR